MLRLIKKMLTKGKERVKNGKGKDTWAKKQFEEMAKLRGKLILM